MFPTTRSSPISFCPLSPDPIVPKLRRNFFSRIPWYNIVISMICLASDRMVSSSFNPRRSHPHTHPNSLSDSDASPPSPAATKGSSTCYHDNAAPEGLSPLRPLRGDQTAEIRPLGLRQGNHGSAATAPPAFSGFRVRLGSRSGIRSGHRGRGRTRAKKDGERNSTSCRKLNAGLQ